jgi:hypothetical protein
MLLVEIGASHPVRRDTALAAEHAAAELHVSHLEWKDPDDVAVFGGIERDVDREGALPHRRPSGEDHQVGSMQAAEWPIQIDKASRDPTIWAPRL